jgi:hypothetical protein
MDSRNLTDTFLSMLLDLDDSRSRQREYDNTTMSLTNQSIQELATLLNQRLHIIADHALRDADPELHLQSLQRVSESIDELRKTLHSELPPRLRHFLEQSSYQKALAYLEELQVSS